MYLKSPYFIEIKEKLYVRNKTCKFITVVENSPITVDYINIIVLLALRDIGDYESKAITCLINKEEININMINIPKKYKCMIFDYQLHIQLYRTITRKYCINCKSCINCRYIRELPIQLLTNNYDLYSSSIEYTFSEYISYIDHKNLDKFHEEIKEQNNIMLEFLKNKEKRTNFRTTFMW